MVFFALGKEREAKSSGAPAVGIRSVEKPRSPNAFSVQTIFSSIHSAEIASLGMLKTSLKRGRLLSVNSEARSFSSACF